MNSFTVTGKIAAADVTVSNALYATYYNSVPVLLPANIEAATVDDENNDKLTLNYRYGEGDVIPGGTAVLLKAEAAGDYTLTYVACDDTAAPAGNLLFGSDEATITTGGAKYYALQYGKGNKASVLGFYWMNEDGSAFESGAHKAWLALPAETSARFFSLSDEQVATGIEATLNADTKTATGNEVYNLNGQRVAHPQKGLYIVNGKKVIIK